MGTQSSILVWRIPWTEEPGRLHTVHRDAKSRTWLKQLSMHTCRGIFDCHNLVRWEWGAALLASTGCKSKMLLYMLQRTALFPTTKSYDSKWYWLCSITTLTSADLGPKLRIFCFQFAVSLQVKLVLVVAHHSLHFPPCPLSLRSLLQSILTTWVQRCRVEMLAQLWPCGGNYLQRLEGRGAPSAATPEPSLPLADTVMLGRLLCGFQLHLQFGNSVESK